MHDGTLYSFRRCPYAIRARMALASAGANPEIREVVLANKPDAMLALGGRGTVPVMQLPDGTLLPESLDIMDWALRQADPDGWLDHRDDATLVSLLQANDGPFKAALDRTKYPERFEPGTTRENARAQTLPQLAALDARLGLAPFFGGDQPRFFDAALFPFVRQLAAVDRAWFDGLPYPDLQRWHASMLEHPAFTRVMKKLPPWKPGDSPVAFRDALL